MTIPIRLAVLSLVSFLFILPAKASTVVFDTFGPGGGYDDSIGYIVQSQVQGPQFSTSGSGFLDFIEAQIASGPDGAPATMELLLFSDSAGQPGTLLEILSAVVAQAPGPAGAPTMFAAAGDIFLDAAMSYWLIARSPDEVPMTLFFNEIGAAGLRAFNQGDLSDPWVISGPSPFPAFRVAVTEIPIPGAAWLFLLGVAGFAASMPGRRRGDARPL